jgi:hypothetical protein
LLVDALRRSGEASGPLAVSERLADRCDPSSVSGSGKRKLVDPRRALSYFEEIEPELYRFPAVEPQGFRRRVEDVLGFRSC